MRFLCLSYCELWQPRYIRESSPKSSFLKISYNLVLLILNSLHSLSTLISSLICASIKMMVNNHIIDVLFIYIGIIFWLRVSKSIYNCKCKNIFLQLSTWTFMIYVAHEMTLSSLKKLCFRLLPTEPIWLLMEYLLLPVVVIIGCSIAGAILKRATPKLYSVVTGAR